MQAEMKRLKSTFKNKKYYVWIKDESGNISNYLTVNSNGEEK